MVATRVGNGPVRLGIIGSLHGGQDLPAYSLLQQFAQGIAERGAPVPPELTLFVLPTLNPDDIESRTGFNVHGVDLNRNFDAIWTAVTCGSPTGLRYGKYGGCKPDGGGTGPFSEAESQVARSLVLDNSLDTVVVVNWGLNTVSSRNGGNGAGESLARDIEGAYHIPYVRLCCATYPVTGQLVDWAESVGVRALEVNAPESLPQQQSMDLLKFILDRAAAPTCTPTQQTGEFALKAAPGADAQELAVINPGEEAIVEAWAYGPETATRVPGGGQGQDPWLLVRLSRPDDGRKGWMFTREVNDARPRCSFRLDDASKFPFPRM